MSGKSSSVTQKYTLIDLEDAIGQYPTNTHASHVLFWTKDNSGDQTFIYCLMQMRSDGRFGFPGGKSDEYEVDKNEIISSLYREIQEEMDYTMTVGQITLNDRIATHMCRNGKILHFFAKELPLDVFQQLERTHMNAQSFPRESMGLIRIPLSEMGQPSNKLVRKFFGNFGKQMFAGNAKNQLIDTIVKLNLIGEQDIGFVTEMMSI